MELNKIIERQPSQESVLSLDYQYIRNTAIKKLEDKIRLLKSTPGSFKEEIERNEEGIKKLKDDNYIATHAKINDWERLREKTDNQDIDDIDKRLADGLVNAAIEGK